MPVITVGRASTDMSWPPPTAPDASEEARLARLQKEAEAKKVSEAIDRAITSEKEQRKKQAGVKLLLLGVYPLFLGSFFSFLSQVKQSRANPRF